MSAKDTSLFHPDLSAVFGSDPDTARPVWFVAEDDDPAAVLPIDQVSPGWLEAVSFRGSARRTALLAGRDGGLAGAAFGLGNREAGEPCGVSELLVGLLPKTLPDGDWRFANVAKDRAELAAIAWGLGAYTYRRYRSGGDNAKSPRLSIPDGLARERIEAIVSGVWLGRDLINTPASDMGPDDLEAAARRLAETHGAEILVTVGEDLLAQNLPMIHAVGRAADRPPRLIDLRWRPSQVEDGGTPAAKLATLTLVGKGICFDTGGLDIKPPNAMLLMKKDMGGAASALALAHMIMALGLPVALRVLIPAAENSIAGNAFRPGDILTSRIGKTVEVGNTDAEGRLVLADALALADEEAPDTLISMATLTGAARVALGPDLPAFFATDDAFAERVLKGGLECGDPLWRMPFWSGYDARIDSDVADMNNVSDGPFAGAITAALFLNRYVRSARRYAHIDLYGWRPAARPLGPKGGEPHAARALLAALMNEVTS